MDNAANVAVAHVLYDMDANRGTLWGRIANFDVMTGAPLARPRREYGWDGHWYPHLPAAFAEGCDAAGLIVWNPNGGGIPHWVVTDKGRAFAKRWLPSGPASILHRSESE